MQNIVIPNFSDYVTTESHSNNIMEVVKKYSFF